ncbi:MAG: hypothetical protein FWF09_00750 [Bacteroidales bacterium]|nr:hypothetical protein [Bacteroidales bacterium]
MERKITIVSVLSNGLALGIKNAASLLGCIVLWALTCWIPYINIGTTIAMACLPLEIAKGNIVSPLAIFDKKYFKYMGEYFLITAFTQMGVMVGMFLFIIPGIVISIAWSLGLLTMVDEGVSPLEALTASNKATMGYKWTIFLCNAILWIAVGIVASIFNLIPAVGWLFAFAVVVAAWAIMLGMKAHIYSKLSE